MVKHRYFLGATVFSGIWTLISLAILFSTPFANRSDIVTLIIHLPQIVSGYTLGYILLLLNIDVLRFLPGNQLIPSVVFLSLLPFTIASMISYIGIRVFVKLRSIRG